MLGTSLESRIHSWPGTYIPNFSDWYPGDLIFVRRGRGLSGLALSAAQIISARKESRAGSVWTHVALYVGNGDLVEAVPGFGVVKASVWKYCHWRSLRVRRLSEPFSYSDGVAVADSALNSIGQPYSNSEVLRSKLIPRTEPRPNSLYCSTFAALTINVATGFSLYTEQKHLPIHPASLANHCDLIDIPLEWRNF